MSYKVSLFGHGFEVPQFSDYSFFKPLSWAEDKVADGIVGAVDFFTSEGGDRYAYYTLHDTNSVLSSNFTTKLEKAFGDKWLEDSDGKVTCFTEGTLISTPSGEVKVETLKEGDEVTTLSGVRKVIWLGIQPAKFSADFSDEQKRKSYPVHILPGALGNGIPSREVAVSAWHHVHINGVLVRAMDLVNGSTIYQDDFVERVTYYHVEFDTYDMIATSGMFSESFSDNGNTRGRFINADPAKLAENWQSITGRSPRPGFKVVRPGDKDEHLLVAIKEQLERIAQNEVAVAC
ncbi:Hint domain-containing protein [Carnimonas bestiolae]|uniref:Hint domain-containing protein n=1 Tax=Carnimonas bestiolae TaxID=3402172 RepID=UPI003EDB7B10